jgi:predicted nucleotidyltransferase component of viral defense system
MEHRMKLHEDKTLFRQAVQFTSDQRRILPIYIEKDYWVTYALHAIFHNDIGEDTVFKGGTALSKCYKMIDRFSEDIDLVVLRREGEADARLKTKLKAISNVVSEVLPEVNVDGLTNKKGMNRKTAHSYSKEFMGEFGQVRDFIVLESTWLGYHEPYTTRQLQSFVGEMMVNNNQTEIAETHRLMPFEVRVLEPTRTLCEKIMSLVRFSYGQDPIDDLKKKIRHTYDLHQLLRQNEFSAFFDSPAFTDMLSKVANDDVASFRNNNEWLPIHPKNALAFAKLEEVWKQLAPVYNGDFRNLVYGDFPEGGSIFETLKRIRDRLAGIEWTIKIPPR